MTLLFSGASGFLGMHILSILQKNYEVTTIGLTPQDHIRTNLSKDILNLTGTFDIILHAAGKAHSVPKTEAERQVFFDVNLQGTKNLCNALEKSGIPKAFIFISTVAVYGCTSGEAIKETHPLEGTSPYALSKKMAEEFLMEWCSKYGVELSILRPSLIAGPNPPGNLGSMINGIKTGRYLSIAGGKAKKSVLMVQDIATLVPILVEKGGGIYNVCDSHHPSFSELEELICWQLNKARPLVVPYWLAKCMAMVGDCLGSKSPINTDKLYKITAPLTFSNEKIIRELDWTPTNVLDHFTID